MRPLSKVETGRGCFREQRREKCRYCRNRKRAVPTPLQLHCFHEVFRSDFTNLINRSLQLRWYTWIAPLHSAPGQRSLSFSIFEFLCCSLLHSGLDKMNSCLNFLFLVHYCPVGVEEGTFGRIYSFTFVHYCAVRLSLSRSINTPCCFNKSECNDDEYLVS